MKRIIGTILASLAILALIVMCIFFGGQSLSELQLDTLNVLLIVTFSSIAYCFITGELTHNYSQMDKLWSLLPIAYAWIIAARGGLNARLVVYALIVTVWGIRLTVNFARKGAYRLRFWEGNEDYRWSIVKQKSIFRHGLVWSLFDLLFISVYQNLLVLAICLPALACMGSDAPLGFADLAAAVLSLSFLMLEAVSDEYQWRFFETKKSLLGEDKSLEDLPQPYSLGFNTLGPWSRMRHPNYLGEQGVWLSLYLFAVGAGVAQRGMFNWSAVGPLLLILLFIGSSTLGESISSGKYPLYSEYIEKVHKYIPLRSFDREK